MAESILFSADFPVSPERIYRAWLDSYEHSQFTGKKAHIGATSGFAYTSLDQRVSGQILIATPFNHIIQTWKLSSFPSGAPFSEVDLRLEPTCMGSQIILEQSGIPDGFSRQVLEIWEKEYFLPLKRYFEEQIGEDIADIDG